MRARFIALLVLFWAAEAGCSSQPCSSQDDCPVGSYCVLSISGGRAEGACEQDCVSSADCEQPTSNASRAVCTNDGRCRVEARPPRLVVLDPEPDAVLSEGTQRVAISGQVEMASSQATVSVTTVGNRGCGTGVSRQITVENETGEFRAIPFVLDNVLVDPGATQLLVQASVPGATKTYPVPVEVACPDCAEITITAPGPNSTGSGLRLSTLQGQVDTRIESAIWRVRAPGGVLDGPMAMAPNGMNFVVSDLPLFPGSNRVEVVVSGVGSGLSETRCSVRVNAGVTAESGLRAILTWDGATSDLDVNLIGPGGRYGDPTSTLSSRSRKPLGFVGTVEDDFDGFGPEVLTVPNVGDGIYGIIVEAAFDAQDPGSTAFLRVLFDGETLTAGPIGPSYLQALTGDLWVAGIVVVDNNQASFESIDLRASAANPPTTPPSMWPLLF